MTLTTDIKDYAVQIGLDEVKITTAESDLQTKKFLQRMKQEGKLSKFVKDDLELITDPTQVLAEAESVIVCAISYHVAIEDQPNLETELRGKLARFAWGRDYHQVLGKKLEQLIDFLKEKDSTVKAKKFVDTGPTVDRALARRAGIGWQGKNCSIIHPEYGSWIFIGGIIINLKLEADLPIENRCGDCQRCLEACPTGALEAPYTLDSTKCLGYLTLSRGYISKENRKQFGTRLWGCDSCQEVCPHNQKAKAGEHSEFKPQTIAAYPKLEPLVNLSKSEYETKFSVTAMNWRGKRPIQRNAAIILGNLDNSKAIDSLVEGLTDSKPIVRAHSAWSLGEIGEVEVLDQLDRALAQEHDDQVKTEMEQAIDKLLLS
ncbi:MAG: tRNA epoxyqueuosine(34) reductase QueG [Bacillota bacterium]